MTLEYIFEYKYKQSVYKIRLDIIEEYSQAQLHTLAAENFTKEAYMHFLCELQDLKVWLRAKEIKKLVTASINPKVDKLVRMFGFVNLVTRTNVCGMDLDVYVMDLEDEECLS